MAGENRGLVDFRNWQNPGVVGNLPDSWIQRAGSPPIPVGPALPNINTYNTPPVQNGLVRLNRPNPVAMPVPQGPAPQAFNVPNLETPATKGAEMVRDAGRQPRMMGYSGSDASVLADRPAAPPRPLSGQPPAILNPSSAAMPGTASAVQNASALTVQQPGAVREPFASVQKPFIEGDFTRVDQRPVPTNGSPVNAGQGGKGGGTGASRGTINAGYDLPRLPGQTSLASRVAGAARGIAGGAPSAIAGGIASQINAIENPRLNDVDMAYLAEQNPMFYAANKDAIDKMIASKKQDEQSKSDDWAFQPAETSALGDWWRNSDAYRNYNKYGDVDKQTEAERLAYEFGRRGQQSDNQPLPQSSPNVTTAAALPTSYERNAPTVTGMDDAAKRMDTIRADIPLMNAQEAAKQSGGVVPDVLPMGTKGGQRTVYTPGKDGRGEYQIYGENGLQGTMSVPAGFMGKDGRQGGGTLSVLGGRTTEEQAAIDERVKQIDSQTAAMRGLRNAGRLAQGGITVEQEDQQNAMAAMMNRLAPPPDMSGFEDRQKALMGQLSAAKDIRGFGKRGQRKDAIDAAQIGLGQLANEQQLATQSYNQNRNAAMQAWQGQQQQDAALSTAQQKNYFDNLKFQAERGDARAKLELDAAIATNNADNEGQRRYMDGEKLKLDAYKALNPSQGKNPIFGLPLDMDGKFNFNAFDQMIGATAIDPKNPGKPKPGSVIRDGVTNLYHFVDDKGNVLSKGIPAVEMGKRYQYSGGTSQEAQQ